MRQLSDDFDRHSKKAIRLFYAKYGRLGTFRLRSHEFSSEREEDYRLIKHYLNWFREITGMVRDIKTRKTSRLWELFKEGKQKSVDEHGNIGELIYLWGDETDICIRWPSWPRFNKDGSLYYGYPQNNDELLIAAREAVTDIVEDLFGSLVSLPIPERDRIVHPMATITIYPPGALAAAFLQWLFQEVSFMNLSICMAEDCDKPVPLPRKDYCSEKCRQRMKKRRQRMKKKESSSR